jgi:hypothetical protein
MNQLEYFLASTDGSRADVMRYMQQLRDLDEWIEYHLAALRAITAGRVVYLAAAAQNENSSGRGRGRGRGRGTTRGVAAPAAVAISPHHVYDVDAAGDEGEGNGGTGSSSSPLPADMATYMAEVQREFEWHETCVRQHCQEREVLAAELAERCAEVRLSMASRLANFASVADVPATELSS